MTNKEQYQQFCAAQATVHLFAQPWWLDAVSTAWDVAIVKRGDHIAGAWPYPIEQKAGVSLLRTPMLTPYLGPMVFAPTDLKESRRDSYEHDVTAELLQQLPQAGVWHLSLQPGVRQAGLFAAHGISNTARQTFLLNLAQDEAALLAGMQESTRRNIKNADRDYTVSNDPGCLPQLFGFQQHTLSRKNSALPYTIAYMQRIMDACVQHSATALWVARDTENNIQAIVWEVWDARCSYYFMGGQQPGSNSYKAMTLLLWHTIRSAKARGNMIFDFEGSMDPGVERFFRNFGGTRELYLVLQKNTSTVWKLKQLLRG